MWHGELRMLPVLCGHSGLELEEHKAIHWYQCLADSKQSRRYMELITYCDIRRQKMVDVIK